MILNALKKIFGMDVEPSRSDIERHMASLTESQARELLGTSHLSGDGTDPRLVRYAAWYALARAEAEGRSVELRLLAKYRGKETGEVADLLSEDETDDLISLGKPGSVPTDASERRKLAAMVFDAMRLMSPYK